MLLKSLHGTPQDTTHTCGIMLHFSRLYYCPPPTLGILNSKVRKWDDNYILRPQEPHRAQRRAVPGAVQDASSLLQMLALRSTGECQPAPQACAAWWPQRVQTCPMDI